MKKTIIGILALSISSTISAQVVKDSIPGDPKLPSSTEELAELASYEKENYTYSVEDYFQEPQQSSFQLSPDGLFMSYREKDSESKNHVYVKNTKTDKITRVIEEGENLVAGYGWANNNRILYLKDKGGDENYQLFAVDADGKNPINLTPYEKVQVNILSFLKDQKDHIIIDMNKDNPEIFEPYKINLKNGALEKLYENTDEENPITSYDFDKDGNLKAYLEMQDGIEYTFYYRTAENKPFKKVNKTNWSENFYILGFNYATDNPNDAYVMSNLENNTNQIFLYDFEGNKIIKTVYAHDEFDVEGMSMSKKRGYEIDYFYYTGEKTVVVPVSATFKKTHKRFIGEFGDKNISIVSKTDNEENYLILVSSDKLYGIYYLYDAVNDTFKELYNLMPSLKPDDMSEMKPIKYTSRDGLTIHGYLTIPNQAKKGSKVPLIVNPHGGPYDERDYWGFNAEAQLFASRGYATLQINYRGSSGYGKELYLAGSKQIGRNMLNDLEDGVAYVKTLNLIDEDKIAIYGASYGGLATLGSLVKTPDLYSCGVDYVGVSNLFTFIDSFPSYWRPYMKQFYEQWYDAENEEEKKIMKKVSPALNVEKITKPLFVIQGANDPRVNINESDQIVESIRKRGYDVPYMVKYNEGHGFDHEENRIELYKTMMGFFTKHLK